MSAASGSPASSPERRPSPPPPPEMTGLGGSSAAATSGGGTDRAAATGKAWGMPSARTLAAYALYLPGVATVAFGSARVANYFLAESLGDSFSSHVPDFLVDLYTSAPNNPSAYFEDGIIEGIKGILFVLPFNPADSLLPPVSKIVFGLGLLLLGRAIQTMDFQKIKNATSAVAELLLRTVQWLGYWSGAFALIGATLSVFNDIFTMTVGGENGLMPEWVTDKPGEWAGQLFGMLGVQGLVDQAVERVEENAGQVIAVLAGISLLLVAALAQRARRVVA